MTHIWLKLWSHTSITYSIGFTSNILVFSLDIICYKILHISSNCSIFDSPNDVSYPSNILQLIKQEQTVFLIYKGMWKGDKTKKFRFDLHWPKFDLTYHFRNHPLFQIGIDNETWRNCETRGIFSERKVTSLIRYVIRLGWGWLFQGKSTQK